MKQLYLSLTHGRTMPDEHLEGWGEDGPIFGPLEWYHVTYNQTIRIGCEDDGVDGGEIYLVEDMVYYDGHYYGDWELFMAEPEEVVDRLEVFDEAVSVPPGRLADLPFPRSKPPSDLPAPSQFSPF